MSAAPEVSAAPDGRAPRRLLSSYRDLMAVPGFWRNALVGMISKLPPSMVTLSLLLLVGRDYSYGTAGLMVSGSAIGQGVTAPLRGRLIDRYAPRPVLLGCLTAYLTVTALLLFMVRNGGPVPVILITAVGLGATAPPVAVMMRSVWYSAGEGATLTTAMALDSSMMGAALITGPVLAGWLSLSVSPVAPFFVTATLTALSVLLLLVHAPAAPRSAAGAGRHWLGPLASPPLRRLLAASGLFVTAVTAVDVLLPLYAKEHDAGAYTGLYLGALSVGSVVGSFGLGAVPDLLARGPKAFVLLIVFVLGTGVLCLGTRLSPEMVLLLCPVAGLAIGSTFGTLRTIGGDLAPPGRMTETMSWLSSLDLAGGAVGAAVFAHFAAVRGSGTALLVVPAVALLAAVFGWGARTRAEPLTADANGSGAMRG
ncbi:MFS transporter [Streptomyces rimosus]|uniref:MFS transporter n=1 Tax=Streptomyces rimosus TaxID=1927 RepID=UPI001F2CDED1|nr:MFS transporter [Streptomyces rimosus]